MTTENRFALLLLPIAVSLAVSLAACGGEASDDAAGADTAQVVAPDAATDSTPADTTSADSTAAAGSAPARINVNTASPEALRAIPGVGEKMAGEFEEYRPFASVLEFRKEIGKYADAATVAGYEQYIFVPIDPNESDAATLQQIRGLDASEVEQVIAGRPYASTEAFLEKVGGFVAPEELAAAREYVGGAQ